MIRDDEINRLVKYAESLGVSVSFRTYKNDRTGAEWVYLDGKRTIIIYIWKSLSKTDIILNLLHELAHEKSFILKGRVMGVREETAANTEEEDLTEAQRKQIYQYEKKDATYRKQIYHELDIKIPKWKLEIDISVDVWFYRYFYLNGKYPTIKMIKAKDKELTERYKNGQRASYTV